MRLGTTLAIAAAALALPAAAEEAPMRGGTLVYAVDAEPPNYDCQGTTTFAALQTLNPHYSQLMKFDPDKYPALKPDLATSWQVSADGLTYTLKLREGVTFHDGSPFTSEDVKVTLDRIRKPPQGVVSVRKARYEDIEAIEAPDAHTIVVKLSKPNSSMLTTLGSPWNCILPAAKVKEDPRWPVKNILGTGPFRFVEHVAGSEWKGMRYEKYFEPGKPYLDGFRAVFIKGAPMVNALQGGQIQAEFRGVSPADRDKLKSALGDKIVIQESPWLCKFDLFFNHEKKPYDDARVRRALSMAIDRWKGVEAMSRIAFVRSVGGVLRPGFHLATPPEELKKLPGFGPDIKAARAEAKQLLKEAGAEKLNFRLLTRNVEMPYQPVVVYLIDQWRQLGLTVENAPLNVAQQKAAYLAGNFEVGLDANCYDTDEPNDQLLLYVSTDRSPVNLSHYTDRTLDELYEKQKRTTDEKERLQFIRSFERRLIEESHSVPVVWWHRIVAHSPALKGWKILPSHYLNQDLASVWLDPSLLKR
jgi:peptide/nickel transport system substrate-binding protein